MVWELAHIQDAYRLKLWYVWETTSDTDTWARDILKAKPNNQRGLAYSSRWLWDVHETQVGNKNGSQEYLRVFSKILYPLPSLPDIWPQCVCAQIVTSYWDYSTYKRTNRKNRPEQFVLFFHNESHIFDKVNNSKFKFCRNKTNQKNAPHPITSNFVAFQKSWYKHFFSAS